jgi:hypothetical protein
LRVGLILLQIEKLFFPVLENQDIFIKLVVVDLTLKQPFFKLKDSNFRMQ